MKRITIGAADPLAALCKIAKDLIRRYKNE